MITSAANKSIKRIIQLNQKAGVRKKEDRYTVEGVKLFLEAPESDIFEIYVSGRYEKSLLEKEQINVLDKLKRVGYETVADEVFAKMTDTKTPQGILCVLKQKHYSYEDLYKSGGAALLLLLEGIQDPGNLGTILRTAEGAGVTGVMMTMDTVDIYNPKTIRSTMGSIYRVPFLYMQQLSDGVAELKRRKTSLFAAHLKGKKYYDDVSYLEPSCFLIGNEAKGLSDEAAGYADCYVKIPMLGEVESLNAAIASAILMYEAQKQRRGVKSERSIFHSP